jgi:hypothetical protein
LDPELFGQAGSGCGVFVADPDLFDKKICINFGFTNFSDFQATVGSERYNSGCTTLSSIRISVNLTNMEHATGAESGKGAVFLSFQY